MIYTMRRKNIGDVLVTQGVITTEELAEVEKDADAEGESLEGLLLVRQLASDKQLVQAKGELLGVVYVSLYQLPIRHNVLTHISQEFAQNNYVIPTQLQRNVLSVAMFDPMNYQVIDDMELSTGFEIRPLIASKDDIVFAISKHYRELTAKSDKGGVTTATSKRTRGSSDEPVVRKMDESVVKLFEQILTTSTQLRASDIHIDPEESYVGIRYRIDGELQQDRKIKKELHASLVARVKILAELDITQTRIPQDGRFRVYMGKSFVDLRVSCLPTVHGEKIVIRVLDMTDGLRDVSSLGFSKSNSKRYNQLLKQPSGLVLLTGPTGSGKSSTLYASIRELNQESVNVMTIEDPVEIELEGISQVQVNTGGGLTFAAGLRSILRQDPNVIMIGEIRDRETAEIAIRAAMTGHLVFSTLHTNSAIETIPRLVEMGVEPFLVASAIKGVVAQRLVRRLCMDCRKKRLPTDIESDLFKSRGLDVKVIYDPVGCDSCHNMGYRGRFAVHELVTIDETMKRLLLRDATMTDLQEHAVSQKMAFLLDDGLLKARSGLTSIDEVMRIAIDSTFD